VFMTNLHNPVAVRLGSTTRDVLILSGQSGRRCRGAPSSSAWAGPRGDLADPDPQAPAQARHHQPTPDAPPSRQRLCAGAVPLDRVPRRPAPWALGRHHVATPRPLMRRKASGPVAQTTRVRSADPQRCWDSTREKASAHLRYKPPIDGRRGPGRTSSPTRPVPPRQPPAE
jgi:hypothetical protein